MLRLVLWITLSIMGATALVAAAQSFRFRSMIGREVEALWATTGEVRPIEWQQVDALPAPVQTYLRKALDKRGQAVRSVQFRHGGRFRTKPNGPWRPIRGEQYDAADPPGFVWWGRLRAAPGLWIDARDRCVNGTGNMLVSFESTVTLTDQSGPEMDQGSMLRLLSDLVLVPNALLDDRYVTWSAIDERRARATLRLNGHEVTGTFEFGGDGLPRSFFADRYYDAGGGRSELRPWSGDYEDYREVEGMIVPHHFIGYWHINGQRVPYVDFQFERPGYNRLTPF